MILHRFFSFLLVPHKGNLQNGDTYDTAAPINYHKVDQLGRSGG